MTATPHTALRRWARIAILAGTAVLVVVLVITKGQSAGPVASTGSIVYFVWIA